MRNTIQSKKARPQGSAGASLIVRAALIVFLAIVAFATPRCIMAADPCQDAPCANENAVLTVEKAMDIAESSSPSVASTRHALELALLQLEAAEAGGRPSIGVHATPLNIRSAFAGVGDVDEGDDESLDAGEVSISVLSEAGGKVHIPIWGGSLSLTADTSVPLSGPSIPGKSGWSANASLSVPLLGAKKEAAGSIGSAQSQARRAQFKLEQAIRQARAQAQAAYFNLLAAQDRVAAADRGLTRARDHAAFVESRYFLGNASKLDMLEAEASAARAEAAAQSALHNLALASMNLNLAIGREIEAPVFTEPVGEYGKWPEGMNLQACVETALAARPEILLAEQGLADAKATLAQAVTAKRPDVFLNGHASSKGSWQVGLEVSATLTRDYVAEIGIESARRQVEQARANVVETRNSIVLEIAEAFYSLLEAETSMELAHSTAAIATATLEVKEEQCRIGAVAYAEVSEAIEAVRKAESDLASQTAACFMAKSKLLASLGQESI